MNTDPNDDKVEHMIRELTRKVDKLAERVQTFDETEFCRFDQLRTKLHEMTETSDLTRELSGANAMLASERGKVEKLEAQLSHIQSGGRGNCSAGAGGSWFVVEGGVAGRGDTEEQARADLDRRLRDAASPPDPEAEAAETESLAYRIDEIETRQAKYLNKIESAQKGLRGHSERIKALGNHANRINAVEARVEAMYEQLVLVGDAAKHAAPQERVDGLSERLTRAEQKGAQLAAEIEQLRLAQNARPGEPAGAPLTQVNLLGCIDGHSWVKIPGHFGMECSRCKTICF